MLGRLQHIGVERARPLHGGEMRLRKLRGGEFSSAQAVAGVRKRQGCKVGHSSGLSQANALAAGAGDFAGAWSAPATPGFGNGRPMASKASAATPGGISPRARKSAHHRRKK